MQEPGATTENVRVNGLEAYDDTALFFAIN